MSDANSPAPPPALPQNNTSVLAKLIVVVGLIASLLGAIGVLLSKIPPLIENSQKIIEKSNIIFKSHEIAKPVPGTLPQGENDIGKKPDGNCHQVLSVDKTKYPFKTTNSWECK